MQKRSRGRPKFEPTDEQRKTVMAMAGYGISHANISTVVGIDGKTLRKHFREELDKGEIVATSKVAESLYKMATDGNVAAAIFWMKARAGWSEKIRIENVNELSETSDRELEHIATGGSAGASEKTNGAAGPDSIH